MQNTNASTESKTIDASTSSTPNKSKNNSKEGDVPKN